MASSAGPFGGLLASAILALDSVGSLIRWHMIFVIAGIITLMLTLLAFITVMDRAQSTR